MRVHFFGPPPRVNVTPEMPIKDCVASVGGNTGNQLFINALMRQVRHSRATFGYRIDPKDINENVGLVVIPAANWLQPNTDLTGWYRALRLTKVPLLLVGLGAQALRYSDTPPLPEGTISFLKLVSERSKSISTRGEYTTSVLKKYGFNNGVTTGCPSLYMHCSPEFPRIKKVKNVVMDKLVIQATRHTIESNMSFYASGRSKIERQLFNFALNHHLTYVFQSEREEMHLALGRPMNEYPDAEALLRILAYYDVPAIETLEEFFKRSRIFFDVEDWMTFLRSMDFVCGTRLHGSIAALLAGVKACLLTHDTRTLEVAELTEIPHCEAQTFVALADKQGFESAINQINSEFGCESFYKRYSKNYSNYRNFLIQNGVQHNLL